MLTVLRLGRIRVLALIGLVRTARHLVVVAVQLAVPIRRLADILGGYEALPQRLALVLSFRVGQLAEATQAAREESKMPMPEMRSR